MLDLFPKMVELATGDDLDDYMRVIIYETVEEFHERCCISDAPNKP